MRGTFEMKSSMLSMDELTEMSDSLRGLQNLKLHDHGEYVFVAPTQILSAPKGSVALDEYGKVSSYPGLPELIMAEDFVGIPPYLEETYVNYESPKPIYSEVFEYDLNKHLIDNILEFRNKIKDKNYFDSLEEEVQEKLLKGKLFTKESDGELVIVPETHLINEDRTGGAIIDHIFKYKVDVVFYSRPIINVKVSEQDKYPQRLSMVKTIETDEEALLYKVPKGMSFETPLAQASKLYLWAFSQVYEKPIYEKYPDMQRKDVRNTSEFRALDEKRLIQPIQYRVLTLVNRIPTNKRGDIEVEAGEKIPAYLGRMSLSSNTFNKVFGVSRESLANYEPSFRVVKAEIPKAEGNQMYHIGQQYMNMKFNEPGIVGSHGIEANSNPFIHKEDKEYAKRVKEISLNFRFKETFVAQNSNTLGKDVTLAELNEIIRQVLVPMYNITKQQEETLNISDSIKSFLINDIKMSKDELEGKKTELEEGLKDAQFSGAIAEENATPQPPLPPRA